MRLVGGLDWQLCSNALLPTSRECSDNVRNNNPQAAALIRTDDASGVQCGVRPNNRQQGGRNKGCQSPVPDATVAM